MPGDLIFFGPNGPKSTAASIYHAALYLGNGWFIQSTGSLDGVGRVVDHHRLLLEGSVRLGPARPQEG